jgi:hypothetical protein
MTYSLGQKKRLYIVVLNCHKHNCLLVLLVFMLLDVFSLTSYYRFYVVVKRLLVLFMLVDAFNLTIYYRLYVGHPVVLYSTIE